MNTEVGTFEILHLFIGYKKGRMYSLTTVRPPNFRTRKTTIGERSAECYLITHPHCYVSLTCQRICERSAECY